MAIRLSAKTRIGIAPLMSRNSRWWISPSLPSPLHDHCKGNAYGVLIVRIPTFAFQFDPSVCTSREGLRVGSMERDPGGRQPIFMDLVSPRDVIGVRLLDVPKGPVSSYLDCTTNSTTIRLHRTGVARRTTANVQLICPTSGTHFGDAGALKQKKATSKSGLGL
jgi:hypothetical protein